MLSIYYCLFALTVGAATAREFRFNDTNEPIQEVHVSYGQFNHERVTFIRAVIRPHHINTAGRNNFPRSGYLNDYFQEAMAQGDERGHLVGSQFSGPAEWYNLSPQNARVNRNAGARSITTDWFGTECEVRRFLERGGDRYVRWDVNMAYISDSNRPNTYHLQVIFFVGQRCVDSIDTIIHNPFLWEDSTFWLCRCASNRRRRGTDSLRSGVPAYACEKEETEKKKDDPSSSNILSTLALGFFGLMTFAAVESSG